MNTTGACLTHEKCVHQKRRWSGLDSGRSRGNVGRRALYPAGIAVRGLARAISASRAANHIPSYFAWAQNMSDDPSTQTVFFSSICGPPTFQQPRRTLVSPQTTCAWISIRLESSNTPTNVNNASTTTIGVRRIIVPGHEATTLSESQIKSVYGGLLLFWMNPLKQFRNGMYTIV